jgi:hypothetical protein
MLREEKLNTGEWKKNVSQSDVARVVAEDICGIWDTTNLPHIGTKNPKKVRERVERLFEKAKVLSKVKAGQQSEMELEPSWGHLFELSLCRHTVLKTCDCPHCVTPHTEKCDCPVESRMTDSWAAFLRDQRAERQQEIGSVR